MTSEWDKLKKWLESVDGIPYPTTLVLEKMKALEKSRKRDPFNVERAERLKDKAKSPKKRATG